MSPSLLQPKRCRWFLIACAAATGLVVACPAWGAELREAGANKVANIGVTNLAGDIVHPLQNAGQKATVLFFVMHDCPVANAYAPEISRISKEYATKGARCFVVYVESDLTLDKARTHAREYGHPSSTLLDPKHLLVKTAKATISPEAAVFSPTGDLRYRGRIDDRVSEPGKRRPEPTVRDLRQALDAILGSQSWTARTTKAVGCRIPED